MDTIATELVTKILIYACSVVPATQLSLVCRSWRDVINISPECWTRVAISWDDVYGANNRVHDALKRTGSHPFDLAVGKVSDTGESAQTPSIGMTLGPHASRLNSLMLLGRDDIEQYRTMESVWQNMDRELGFKALEELIFAPTAEYNDAIRAMRNFVRTILQTARIRHLRLPVAILPKLSSPLPALRSLSLYPSKSHHDFDAIETFRFLERCPNVTFFANKSSLSNLGHRAGLSGLEKNWTDRVPNNGETVNFPLLCPNLTHAISFLPTMGYGLLHCLEAPKLQHVVLDGRDESSHGQSASSTDQSTLLKFTLFQLALRSPDLRSLEIIEIPLQEAQGWLFEGKTGSADVQTLAPFPRLESLTIDGFVSFDKVRVMQQLGETSSMSPEKLLSIAGWIKPSLKRLHLRSVSNVDVESLFTFAIQRLTLAKLAKEQPELIPESLWALTACLDPNFDLIIEDCPQLSVGEASMQMGQLGALENVRLYVYPTRVNELFKLWVGHLF